MKSRRLGQMLVVLSAMAIPVTAKLTWGQQDVLFSEPVQPDRGSRFRQPQADPFGNYTTRPIADDRAEFAPSGGNTFTHEMRTSEKDELHRLQVQDKKHESQTRALLFQYRETNDSVDRRKLKEKLKSVLGGQFDTRQSMQELELIRVEQRIQKLREQLELRKQERANIVRTRLEQLIREAEGLGWGSSLSLDHAKFHIERPPLPGN